MFAHSANLSGSALRWPIRGLLEESERCPRLWQVLIPWKVLTTSATPVAKAYGTVGVIDGPVF